jgi:hypothetical protein
MQCPRCQQDNPSHATFCLAYGTPVAEAPSQARRCADLTAAGAILAFLTGMTGGLLVVPLAAEGQQAETVPRIGWLDGPTRESAEPFVREFQRGLKDLGWVEGQNIVIEWRCGGGRAAQ